MVRRILSLFVFFLIFAAVGADFPAGYSDWNFVGDFKIYHKAGLTLADAAAASYDKPVRGLAAKTLPTLDPSQDFNVLFGYAEPVARRTAIAVNRINVKQDGRIQIGVGADWHIVLFVDGKKVFDTIELGGNGSAPAKKNNHAVDVALTKGIHTVSFWLSSGATTWSVASGKIPYTKVIYPVPALKYGPYITDVHPDGAVISFATTHAAPVGIEVSCNGKKIDHFWSHTGYQIDPRKKLHRIAVDGLKENTKYSYRIVYLERPDNNLKYMSGAYDFSTSSASFKPFKMFVTGDLQFVKDVQLKILDAYVDTDHMKSSELFVSLGDTAGAYNDFESSIFGVSLKAVLERSGHARKLLLVRGNHEFRGKESCLFTEHFAMRNGFCYGLYVYNDVAFLILDIGNGAKVSRAFTRHFTAYDMPELLLREQRKVIARAVKSPEFLKAKYRVVLSHGAVFGADGSVEKYTRRIIDGIVDKNMIHLWLSGHIHRYRRTVPGKQGFYGFSPSVNPADKDFTDGKYPFVTMIIDGPGIAKPHSGHTIEFQNDAIKCTSFFEDGKPFDYFEIDRSGKVRKESAGKELKFFDFK